MTVAWYVHLRDLPAKPWFLAVPVSWGIAFVEYVLQVPANRIGFRRLDLGRLKILQEVITLAVFVSFARPCPGIPPPSRWERATIPVMIKEFREFISRGNVVDLAVAVVIGAAFGRIVTTFAENVLMPPVGLLTAQIDFASLFYALDSSKGIPASLAEAKTNGVPVIAYGQLITDMINFVIIAFAVFLLVRQVNRLKREAPAADPTTKDCPFCLSAIPLKATRCGHCTSQLA